MARCKTNTQENWKKKSEHYGQHWKEVWIWWFWIQYFINVALKGKFKFNVVATGSPLEPVIANIFMDELETILVSK